MVISYPLMGAVNRAGYREKKNLKNSAQQAVGRPRGYARKRREHQKKIRLRNGGKRGGSFVSQKSNEPEARKVDKGGKTRGSLRKKEGKVGNANSGQEDYPQARKGAVIWVVFIQEPGSDCHCQEHVNVGGVGWRTNTGRRPRLEEAVDDEGELPGKKTGVKLNTGKGMYKSVNELERRLSGEKRNCLIE